MRQKNTIKNFLTTFVPFLIIGILGFVKTKLFVNFLGDEIVALDQLFYQILAYLSLAEGGIGFFIIQKYYGFFDKKDYKNINQIYTSSKYMFRNVGFFLLGAGFFISFFVSFFTNNHLSSFYMQIVFLLFILKNSIDYFMFSSRFVLQADQKMYKINLIINTVRVLEIVSQIILVSLGVNYLFVLIPGIIFSFIFNTIINHIIAKEYPWLENNKKPRMSDLKGIRHLINQKISGVVYSNTDIIVLSIVLKPVTVVTYSAYNYITKYLSDFVYLIVQALSPSYANVLHKESDDVQHEMFREVNIIFLFIGGFVSLCFFFLSNSFVKLWIGEDYVLSQFTLFLMTAILFITISQKPTLLTKDCLGLFRETKRAILAEAIVNLTLSIALVYSLGINGILIATCVATLITTAWYIPKILYKYHFKAKILDYCKDVLLSLILVFITYFILQFIPTLKVTNYFNWFVNAIVVSILVLFILFITYTLTSKVFRNFLKRVYWPIKEKLKRLGK